MMRFIPEAEALIPLFVVFLLISVRITFLFLISPVLSAAPMPRKFTGAILVLISVAVFFGLPDPSAPRLELGTLVLAIVGEASVGTAAGLTARLVFAAAEGAGRLLGIPMGLAFSNMVDPMTRVQAVVTSRFLGLIMAMIFLVLDMHLILIRLVAKSFVVLPPGQVIPSPSVGLHLSEKATLIFNGTMQLAAPVLLVLLGVMMAMAILAKVAPKVNLMVLSFAMSIALGLISMRAAIPEIVTWTRDAVTRIEPLVAETIGHF